MSQLFNQRLLLKDLDKHVQHSIRFDGMYVFNGMYVMYDFMASPLLIPLTEYEVSLI